jgi:hypothetical protein
MKQFYTKKATISGGFFRHFTLSGEYRIRTGDLLPARQAL